LFRDQFYDVIYAERNDVKFYVEATRNCNGLVLEAGCGTGRVLLPCVEAGAEVVGFDMSAPRIQACREKLKSASPETRGRASVHEGNMLTCDFGSNFDLVILPFRVFQDLVTPEDGRQALLNLRRHLRPGGRIILDLFNPSIPMLANTAIATEFSDSSITLADGQGSIDLHYRICSRDYFTQRQAVEEIVYLKRGDGSVERQANRFEIKYTFRFELEHLLELCGFKVEQVFGDFERGEFGKHYPGEMIMMACKHGVVA
jgi:SAM-dependent methyltransferase